MNAKASDAVVGKPLYTHDCEDCVFLGHVMKHDLYFCDLSFLFTERAPLSGERTYTIIARDSSRPDQYTSGGEEVAAYSPHVEVGIALARAYKLI